MPRAIVITQGCLAQELVEAGRRIAGGTEWIDAVCLGWEDDVVEAREKIGALLREPPSPDGTLLLLDMFGSTPYNAAIGFLDPGRVEIVTGVNLPMVVRLGCLFGQQPTVAEAAELLLAKGKISIRRAEPGAQPSAPSPCLPQPGMRSGDHG